VLGLEDLGCATSSIRVRHWRVGGREVHHIIDPGTGEPADSGLLSVTVVGPDTARAEVWSKALFLAGRGRVRQVADELDIAALLVDDDGVVGVSRAMRTHLIWQAGRGF
jgi:thiamine biosynthesis lipoprotein